ncbi:MAG: transketolase family protein, partial [Saprospiraceae bacterium]|nr:transketolase family protein [Saprospiraceae bacterium]
SLAKTGCGVTAEEHQIAGGLGGSIAQLASQNQPVPLEFVGVNDSFGESGKPVDLMNKYGLGVSDIIAAAKNAIHRK